MGFCFYFSYGTLSAIAYFIYATITRIYFHPLSKFPGPKLAAASRFYEWYLDCIQPGIQYQKIQEWHRQYGPIIRIGPNEVHVHDPEWFDVLYNANTKLDKDPRFYGILGNHDSAFVAVEHEVHRIKRSKQNPFFSRQNVDKSAPLLVKVLQNLFDQFETYRGTGRPVDIRNAMKSYATDVVCEYCFPQGMDFTKSSDFASMFHRGQEGFTRNLLWIRHFPILATIRDMAPAWSLAYLDKEAQACVEFLKFVGLQVSESIRRSQAKEPEVKKTIIRELYESNLPAEYRTWWCLMQEATGFVSGGVATTSRALEGSIFHILDDPAISSRLSEEVRGYRPEQKGIVTHRELETLPYLGAVVLECQRMFTALPGRLPRINRTQDMFYKGWRIPRGTTIGMAPDGILLNDEVWGNAHEFDPSRWLDPDRKARMQRYMVSFGRGSRNCIGQNLAMAEIYTVIGNLFRSFDAELYETDIREIECVQDSFTPLAYKDSKGVRVLLK